MEVVEASPDTIDALLEAAEGELVVVAFGTPGCPHCRSFEAELPELAAALAGTRSRLLRIDAAAHPALALRLGIAGVPAFLLFRGGRRLGRITGYPGRAGWLQTVRAHLPPGDGPATPLR